MAQICCCELNIITSDRVRFRIGCSLRPPEACLCHVLLEGKHDYHRAAVAQEDALTAGPDAPVKPCQAVPPVDEANA